MNKKKIIIIITSLLIIATIACFIIFRKPDNNVSRPSNKTSNTNGLDNYRLTIKEYTKEGYSSSASFEETYKKEIELNEQEKYEHIISRLNEYYNIGNKQIFKQELSFNSEGNYIKENEFWYYKTDSILSTNNDNYLNDIKKLKSILSSSKNKIDNNNYVLDKDEDVYNEVTEIVKTFLGHDSSFSYEADEIKYNLKNSNFDEIEIHLTEVCDEVNNPSCMDLGENKIIITFDQYNQIDGSIPKNVQESLEKTTAKNWVGKYTDIVKCERCNNDTYENTIELTSDFDFINGRGWKTKISMLEDNVYVSSSKYYYIIDDKIYIIDMFGEKYLTGKITNNKIELIDENGQIIETLSKK